MKQFWPFTRRPSATSELLQVVSKLATELAAQSEASRNFSQKLLQAIAEKDSQIKLVLESKFQSYVALYPSRPPEASIPESIEHLSDVSEMSEDSAEIEVEKATRSEREAGVALEQSLREQFLEIAREHAEAHSGKAEA